MGKTCVFAVKQIFCVEGREDIDIGAMIIGFSSIIVEAYQSASVARAIVLLIIIVFLQFRPKGLFTIRSRSLDEG